MPPEVPYRPTQRYFALAYGLATHLLFLAAVATMAASLYVGMRLGRGRLTGGWAMLGNGALLLQFPALHSWLLHDSGRRFLTRWMPLNLGRPLATTTFAGIASVQLLAAFWAWSPTARVLWRPGAEARGVLTLGYAMAWLLLMRGMSEAGLGLQSGSLGWRSVWRQRQPAYPPLPDRGLHRFIRQPIYASFTLILWFAPTFTLDKVAVATVWTLYCVAGSALKEQRYARKFGDAFRAYQHRVPFWCPWPRRRRPDMSRARDADVLIIGGGPVGLLLAALLGRSGKSVLLFEARSDGPQHSMAIGITPPSLDILQLLGLAETCTRQGVRIRTAVIHENARVITHLNFPDGPAPGECILSLPQSGTMRLLGDHLAACATVCRMIGWRVTGLRQDDAGVILAAADPQFGVTHTFSAPLAAGCDGARGATPGWLGLRRHTRVYAPAFVMGDFLDHSGLGNDAHLFFGVERPVESFPLPGGRRRWIVRRGWRDRDDLSAPLAATVTRLTGVALDPADQLNESPFRPEWSVLNAFYKGRVALCGDAAHIMSPIGGQGMNTGFGDAAYLARAFADILDRNAPIAPWMRAYNRHRRRSFRRAARRSALGMALGVAHGALGSVLRRAIIQTLLGRVTCRTFVARWFTMRSLPHPLEQAENAFQRRIQQAALP